MKNYSASRDEYERIAKAWSDALEMEIYILACAGWRLYFANFMFVPIEGSMPQKIHLMKRAIEKFYGRICTAFVRNPRSLGQQDKLPRFKLLPDRPGGKRGVQSIHELKFNAGIHYNGLLAFPLISKFKGSIPALIQKQEQVFRQRGGSRIDLAPITETVHKLKTYPAKTIRCGLASYDDAIVLPRLVTELSGPRPFFDPDVLKLKDIQSALNVSDESAKKIQDRLAADGRDIHAVRGW